MNRRIRQLGIGVLVLYVLLFAQLNRVQLLNSQELRTDPLNVRPLLREFGRPRGEILSADGVVLARSVATAPDSDIDYLRRYPTGERFAHIVGFQSFNQGSFGLERSFNDELAGERFSQQFQSPADLFGDRDSTGNLLLTLRDDVQRAAAAALGQRRGSVVALDPSTGEIVAMWTYPSFDPNLLSGLDGPAVNAAYEDLSNDPDQPLLAKSFREVFFPGSTFKIITAAAGVESGSVSPSTPVFGESEEYQPLPSGSPIRNFADSQCGGDLREVLRVSCNTAFAEMGAEWIGPQVMVRTAENFGFNDTVPFDVPGAVASRFPTDYGKFLADVEYYRGRDAASGALPNGETPIHEGSAILAQTAIGQNDVASTPLQMALVAAAVANQGVLMVPHVVAEVTAADGTNYETTEPEVWRIAASPQVAEVLREAMLHVVADGTARSMAVPGLVVGGKTGTAQLGTDPPNSHAWVVGFAGRPGDAATLAVAVIVEAQPGADEQTGGRVAAPIAQAVIQAAFHAESQQQLAPNDGA
ncbi:MAG: penicillin-binding transpeptidase domain-containing protein [Acidimicrobiaceae bacterium]|nr:penicillin-binding protein 2 [Acidimicrobiia bacterium]MCY4493425.1 penicillin-binding transpeptidase domain-containing protein [Acidimicrobiaceae bacterium]